MKIYLRRTVKFLQSIEIWSIWTWIIPKHNSVFFEGQVWEIWLSILSLFSTLECIVTTHFKGNLEEKTSAQYFSKILKWDIYYITVMIVTAQFHNISVSLYTVIYRLLVEHTNCCPVIVEKAWETVVWGLLTRTSFPGLIHTWRTIVWLLPK
jgi:hypothetical protein